MISIEDILKLILYIGFLKIRSGVINGGIENVYRIIFKDKKYTMKMIEFINAKNYIYFIDLYIDDDVNTYDNVTRNNFNELIDFLNKEFRSLIRKNRIDKLLNNGNN